MNQKEFITTGKEILPVTILKWIWKNLDKIDMIIDFLQSLRTVRAMDAPGCTDPKPTYKPTPNGEWECIGEEWKWIEDLG